MKTLKHESVFLLPHKNGYLVFAPLAGRVLFVNAALAGQLQIYLETGDSGTVGPEITAQIGGLNWLAQQPEPKPLPVDRHFHPSHVTLFLTNRCNLKCSYCYAQAGDFDSRTMPGDVYESAIDFASRNATRAGRPLQVDFHGGGEPTVAWKSLRGAVEYAKEVAPDVMFGLATNGVMLPGQAEFIAKNFRMVTISLDGPPDIQNRQRPRLNGTGSFSEVMAFINVLQEHKTSYAIRSTVTSLSSGRLSEMVEFFVEHTDCRLLHFEPVSCIGRCRELPAGVPHPMEFARDFLGAMNRAKVHGVRAQFSGARPVGIYSSFCGCAQDGFSVTPKGDVTACFEVCGEENPLKETFFYGKLDRSSKRFVIDMEKLGNLRSMTVHNKPQCARCFAKWSCAGDCLIKGDSPSISDDGEDLRCRMIRSITQAMLAELAGVPG